MPELPEVEIVRRGLAKLVPDLIINTVTFDWPKGFPNSQTDVDKFLIGAHFTKIRRRAKLLLLDLSSGYSLAVHLKMTGQLVFVRAAKNKAAAVRFAAGHPNDSLVGRLPDKSTRVTILFKDGSHLYFNDQRKFGWMRLLPTAEIPNLDFMKKVGPEPLGTGITTADFCLRVRRRANTSIKAAIMDQTIIAGIGNIYADESLWGAKIFPGQLVKKVSDVKLNKLLSEIRAVLTLAIAKGGSTDRNYVNAEGKKGNYINYARVFRREGQPCYRHPDTIILKIRVAGRGTHYCPKCQKRSV